MQNVAQWVLLYTRIQLCPVRQLPFLPAVFGKGRFLRITQVKVKGENDNNGLYKCIKPASNHCYTGQPIDTRLRHTFCDMKTNGYCTCKKRRHNWIQIKSGTVNTQSSSSLTSLHVPAQSSINVFFYLLMYFVSSLTALT